MTPDQGVSRRHSSRLWLSSRRALFPYRRNLLLTHQTTSNRRTALALTIGLSSISLLAGNGIGHIYGVFKNFFPDQGYARVALAATATFARSGRKACFTGVADFNVDLAQPKRMRKPPKCSLSTLARAASFDIPLGAAPLQLLT
jgi:hypothetical protein